MNQSQNSVNDVYSIQKMESASAPVFGLEGVGGLLIQRFHGRQRKGRLPRLPSIRSMMVRLIHHLNTEILPRDHYGRNGAEEGQKT